MLLLLFLLGTSHAFFNVKTSPRWRPSWMPPVHEEDCTFERTDSYHCLKKYVDVKPKDGQITKQEIDDAIAKYLPTYLKPILW